MAFTSDSRKYSRSFECDLEGGDRERFGNFAENGSLGVVSSMGRSLMLRCIFSGYFAENVLFSAK
jgi:hypothetical protein